MLLGWILNVAGYCYVLLQMATLEADVSLAYASCSSGARVAICVEVIYPSVHVGQVELIVYVVDVSSLLSQR
jgi:hypothetical protein